MHNASNRHDVTHDREIEAKAGPLCSLRDAAKRYRRAIPMNDAGMTHELPSLALWDLGFAAFVIGMIAVVCVRRWAGIAIPDRAGWEPRQILSDQRFRVVLGLALTTAWASVIIALIRHALRPGVVLATHFGSLPLPPWLALVLQDGHRMGLTYALWATGLWLDLSISKRWSRPPHGPWPAGQNAFAMFLTFLALAFSLFG
jgi:hypothetical protein